MTVEHEVTTLVRRARSGDRDAWEELVGRFKGLVVAIARSFRLAPDDAADVLQQTWLRLFESIDRVREPERLAAWIATTARRECLRLLRNAGREDATGDVDGRGDGTGAFPAPDEELISAQERTAVQAAVRALPDRHRRLMTVLMATTRPSYVAVAETLEMPIGSIGPTRMRAIERLRRDPHVMALAS
jgi:RNA polymerase sigma factor (sigma-70 family)